MNEPDPESNRAHAQPPPGRASLRQVASEAQVAVSSVSRVLSGHPDVSDRMRTRVLSAVDRLGYEQNLLWEGLRRGVTMTVGMFVRDISSRLWADIVLHSDLVFQERGYSMLLANSRGDRALDAEQIRILDQRRVDAMLLSPDDPGHQPTLDVLERIRVPLVLIDRDVPSSLHASAVLIDLEVGLRASLEHLLDLGHRRIGCIMPPLDFRPAQTAQALFDRIRAERDCEIRERFGPFTEDHGEAATNELLTGPDRVTAIVSGSGQAFPGVMRAIRGTSLVIPDDLSLVAIDDIPLLGEFRPSVSMVSRQPGLVGWTAADLAIRMLNGEPAETVSVPSVYKPAGSCGRPPTLVRG